MGSNYENADCIRLITLQTFEEFNTWKEKEPEREGGHGFTWDWQNKQTNKTSKTQLFE